MRVGVISVNTFDIGALTCEEPTQQQMKFSKLVNLNQHQLLLCG